MEVRATQRGYYGGIIRDDGDVFTIAAEGDLGSWMEPLSPLDHDKDGTKGGSLPSGKPKAADRIAMARDLTGRDDITTAKEADAILDAAGGADDI